MKNIFSILISLALTSIMAAGWFFDHDSMVNFAITFYWFLIFLTIPLSLVIFISMLGYQEGKLTEDKVNHLFESLGKNRGFFKALFNLTMTSCNLSLMIACGFGVTAFFYLLSSILSILTKNSVIKVKKERDSQE